MRVVKLLISLLAVAGAGGYSDPPRFFMLDTTRRVVEEVYDQWKTKVVFNSHQFIAFWVDSRIDLIEFRAIFAARISENGVLQDSIGKLVHRVSEGYDINDFGVAANGDNILLVWEQRVYIDSGLILAKRLGPDLAPLDSEPVLLEAGNGYAPRVTAESSSYLVTWWARDTLWGRRIYFNGRFADSAPVAYFAAGPDVLVEDIQVASAGTTQLIALKIIDYAMGEYRICGLVADSAGCVRDTLVFWKQPVNPPPPRYDLMEGCRYQFGLCFANGNYFLTFSPHSPTVWYKIFGARVNPAGVLIDTIPVLIDSVRLEVDFPGLRVTGGNGIYLMAVQFHPIDGTGYLYCRRIDSSGQPLDSGFIAIDTDDDKMYDPDVAGGNGLFVVAWDELKNLTFQNVKMAVMNSAGQVLDTAMLSTAGGTHRHSDVEFDGTNYLFVWRSNVDNNDDIWGVFISPEGTVQEPGVFKVFKSRRVSAHPRLCFDGENYFMVVMADNDIVGVRITQQGEVLDSGIIIRANPDWYESVPDVACLNDIYLVVYSAAPVLYNDPYLFGTRVRRDGTLIDTFGFMIFPARLPGGRGNFYPAVTSNQSRFFVAWIRGGANSSEPNRVLGAFVDTAAVVYDTILLSFTPGGVVKDPLALATDGSDFLVAWSNGRIPPANVRGVAVGTRISADGAVLDSAGIFLGGRYPTALVFDGNDYILLRGKHHSLNLSPISQNGIPYDTAGWEIKRSDYYLADARLAGGHNSRLAVTVAEFTPEPYNTTRVYGAICSRPPVGVAEPERCSGFAALPTVVNKRLPLMVRGDNGERADIEIYSADGRRVLLYNQATLHSDHRVEISISSLPAGVYFVRTGLINRPVKVVQLH
ncbi:MAG: T9SS type A sorting domain-containing protein [candidate division WOR-3 bacterium]